MLDENNLLRVYLVSTDIDDCYALLYIFCQYELWHRALCKHRIRGELAPKSEIWSKLKFDYENIESAW